MLASKISQEVDVGIPADPTGVASSGFAFRRRPWTRALRIGGHGLYWDGLRSTECNNFLSGEKPNGK